MIKTAKRLYDLGFAVHWLKPDSKAPVKGGWSNPTRDDFKLVKQEYRAGYGLGVRLGEASNLGDGFLAVIDLDVKSTDPKHYAEAIEIIDREFPGLRDSAPFVATGRGNGSGHYYVKTEKQVQSGKLGSSSEEVEVYSPSSEINTRQQSLVSAERLKEGFRSKKAWEVEFMSARKQVVLPPTLHADTKKPYIWVRPITSAISVPLVRTDGVERRQTKGRPLGTHTIMDFKAVAVDLVGSSLSDKIVDMIINGTGVSDFSAACFSATLAMIKAGFKDVEILSVLTDRENSLGNTAYAHRGHTKSRKAAAAWVRDYCIAKAHNIVDADKVFESEVVVSELLTDEQAAAQCKELTEGDSWENKISRTGRYGDGPPAKTLENVELILVNAVAPDVIKRDVFAYRDAYGCDTPWGGKKGHALTDDDAVLIKLWLGKRYRFEPTVQLVFEAMTAIAVQNSYHPVQNYLNSLPEWDGVNRLDTFFIEYFNADRSYDKEYLAQVFRKFLVGAVSRVFSPGIYFGWMPIFEGAQRIGKSSFGKILSGGKWFLDWLPELSNKDSALSLQGHWIVEMAELANLRHKELEVSKAFITRQVDIVRPPYGRKNIEAARQCVFMGTTNQDEYLRDESGNMRFNPVRVGQLKFARLEADRNQLFAEALFIFRNGLEETLELTGNAKAFADVITKSKMVRDELSLIEEEIRDLFEVEKTRPENEQFLFNKFKICDLVGRLNHTTSFALNRKEEMVFAKVLKRIGGEKYRNWEGSWWKLDLGIHGSLVKHQ